MRRLLVAATVLLFLALGCKDGGDDSSSSSTSFAPEVSTTTVPGPEGLKSLIVQEGPSGFEVEPDGDGGSGFSDLARAASDDGRPEATVILTSMGYEQGYRRTWAKDASSVALRVYEFASNGSALAFNLQTQTSLQMPPFSPFSVPTVPMSSAGHAPMGPAFNSVIQFAKGDFMVRVSAMGADQASADQYAVEAAEKQFRNLPGT